MKAAGLASIIACLALTACASIADAGTVADVSVLDRTTGETLPLYHHKGKLYVEGRVGNRYAVQMRNRTGERILTVLSVDGVNAVSGQTAASSQTGYVLSPWSRAEIAGWRKSDQDVAAFYFTALGDSYAARTDRPDNVGVIGVAIFKEYQEPPLPPRVQYEAPTQALAEKGSTAGSVASRDAASPQSAPAPTEASARRKEEKIGTGHGERIHSPTYGTEFRRASTMPAETVIIYYDTKANLIAQGIIPHEGRNPRLPRAFPGGFVPDPS